MSTQDENDAPPSGRFERVHPSELRVGDDVWQGGKFAWARIREIHEITEASPEWERNAGKYMFVCDANLMDGDHAKLIAYARDDLVTRSRK